MESVDTTKLGRYATEYVTSLRMKSTFFKWLMRVAVTLCCLLFILLMSLRSEVVQSLIARQIADIVEDRYGLLLDFESLYVDLWNQQFALENCSVGIAGQDPSFLQIETIELGDWHWTQGNWKLGALYLAGANLDAEALSFLNTRKAPSDPTLEKEILEVALEHLLIENFVINFELDSIDLNGIVERLEVQHIQLFNDTQNASLIDFKGFVSGEHIGGDTLQISQLSGVWSSNASQWHCSSGLMESNLFQMHFDSEGLWDQFEFREVATEAFLKQRNALPRAAELAGIRFDPKGSWGPWIASNLEKNNLQGNLKFVWKKPLGWDASLNNWTGLPGIDTLDSLHLAQTNNGVWTASGHLAGNAIRSLTAIGSLPAVVEQGYWLDSLKTYLGKEDDWSLKLETAGKTMNAFCSLKLERQPLPVEWLMHWKPSAEGHYIQWNGQNIPPWIGLDLGYGQAWKTSGDFDWTPDSIRSQSRLTLSNGGFVDATMSASRSILQNSKMEWIAQGTLNSRDNPMPLDLTWSARKNKENWNWECESLWLGFQPFMLSNRKSWELHAKTAIRANGEVASGIQVSFEMRNINLLENGRPMAFNRFDLFANWTPKSSEISWNSDLTDGSVNIRNDWQRWKDWIAQWKIQKNDQKVKAPNFQADCSIRSFAPIAAFANLPLTLKKGAELKAYSHDHSTNLELQIPQFGWDNYEASGIHFNLEDNDHSLLINGHCDSILQAGNVQVKDIQIDLTGDSVLWANTSLNLPNWGYSETNWVAKKIAPNRFDIQLTKLALPFGNQSFEVSSSPHKLALEFTPSGMEVHCKNMRLVSENWSLFTEGSFRANAESAWKLDLSGSAVPEFITPPFDSFSGNELEASFEWSRFDTTENFTAAFQGQNIAFKTIELEDFDLFIDGNKSAAHYLLSAQIESEAALAAEGFLLFDEQNNMHHDLDLASIPLQWLNLLMPPNSVEWEGGISGELAVNGTIEKPSLTGSISSDSASVYVDYLGTDYALNGLCKVVPDEFFLDQWEATDSEGHTARINGTIMHDNFTNWNFDVGLEAFSPFQLLQLEREDNDWFYGKAFATGDVNVFGFDDNLQIEAELQTSPGTKFALPLDGTSDASYASFIHFQQNNDPLGEPTKRVPDLSRFKVDLNIEVTEDAEARIIFDETVGDEILGMTRGDLSIEISDFEKINMTGQLKVVEGAYFFTLQNLINKQFDIEPGGTISWFGDPYEAEIDINTLYKVRTSLDGILPEESNLPGRVPVHLNLAMQGALMRPEIGFSIQLPEASPQLKSLLEGALINEEELNRQSFSLLVLNQFLSPDPLSSGLGGDIVQDKSTAFIANQLGHWISQISPDMDIGFDYANDPMSEDQSLAVALSTRLLDDRLHVEGAVGTNQLSQVSAQTVQLQDMTLSYDLDENGSLQLTGHTRQNPEWSSPYGATTQGVGLRFHREFNNWGERRKARETNLND